MSRTQSTPAVQKGGPSIILRMISLHASLMNCRSMLPGCFPKNIPPVRMDALKRIRPNAGRIRIRAVPHPPPPDKFSSLFCLSGSALPCAVRYVLACMCSFLCNCSTSEQNHRLNMIELMITLDPTHVCPWSLFVHLVCTVIVVAVVANIYGSLL